MAHQVATFYRFVTLKNPHELMAELDSRARRAGLKGTVLIAPEGINGTLTGSPAGLGDWLDELCADQRFAGMPVRYAEVSGVEPVFHRLKFRLRDEVVALRQPDVDPALRTGQHVDAVAWNALLDDPDVTVLDTRNAYEIAVGTFPGAIDPGTRSFREFPESVAALGLTNAARVAMFCTGGVRCEKASAYLLSLGIEEVYQLDGGILNYLETAGASNRFEGECFVFDQRVTVTDELEQGGYVQCHACRRALAKADLASPWYFEGVSCGHCHEEKTTSRRAGFAERQRQVEIAARRGERHVGADMTLLRRNKKRASATDSTRKEES